MDDIDLLFKLDLNMEEVLNALRRWLLEPLGVKNGMCYNLFCDVCPAREICRFWIKTVVNIIIKSWEILFDEIGFRKGRE